MAVQAAQRPGKTCFTGKAQKKPGTAACGIRAQYLVDIISWN
jgi:hypothetical protein